eukprot:CAMPEP_0194135722 /NCGR_PEP_ID=MMETSP0152-20130528/5796_1 /TAXON_ID=1049557 /ORGANISM="Thalassiothrix antarctica, Strain L6-D1" /LENGTH=178 /DNA_ID=CAMNT_0038832075 /DNA_START=45 /DNA_END=581 /DNA_ORIENTATION=-
MRFIILLSLTVCTAAYSPSFTRRDVMRNFAASGIVVANTQAANALSACNPKANNCVFAKLTPPSGKSKSAAIKDIRAAIKAYPKNGQANIDGGGWKIIKDDLGLKGTARIEYRSSGNGFFAKALNDGKPFVDDLELQVNSKGVVQFKSQSRVGDSDFGVNKKRVKYLSKGLKSQGWTK